MEIVCELTLVLMLGLGVVSLPGCSRMATRSVVHSIDITPSERSVNLAPATMNLWRQAIVFRQRGQPNDAIPLYRKIVDQTTRWPETVKTRVGLAAALLEAKQFDQAMQVADATIRLCVDGASDDDVNAIFSGFAAANIRSSAAAMRDRISRDAAMENAALAASRREAPLYILVEAMARWNRAHPEQTISALRRVHALDPSGPFGEFASRTILEMEYGPGDSNPFDEEKGDPDSRASLSASRIASSAKQLDNQGHPAAAIKLLDAGMVELKGTRYRTRLHLEKVRILERQGDRKAMIREANALFREAAPDDFLSNAWCLMASHEFTRTDAGNHCAVPAQELRQLCASSNERAKGYYRFALAVAMAKQGRKEDAARAFHDIAVRYRGSKLAVSAAIASGQDN